MSTPAEAAARQGLPPATTGGGLAIAVLNAVGMTVLFGTEIIFMAVALVWSIAGLLGVGPVVYLPLGAICVGISLWATAWIGVRAWRYERAAAR